MKFTLSWLEEHLDTKADLNEIVETLIKIGLEVDKIDNPGSDLSDFKVAKVVKADKHPNADRLKVCIVDTGQEKVEVVCGAPNARDGMMGVFAPVGSYIPGLQLKLKKTKIRGVQSNGMLVSEKEMGLSEEHDGIIEVSSGTQLGTPIAVVLGIDDPVIDIELTPNRPDCTGVRGIARDLAAAGLGQLKPLSNSEPLKGSYESPLAWEIANDGNACNYVVGRHFKGLKNGPSPNWLQNRLKAIGLRPISALVDVTNYISIDVGRPLHVFDAGKLKNKKLTMRKAKNKESFYSLIDKEFVLDTEKTVIADGDKVEALAGVMGGMESSCLPETTEVFLEVALFDPIEVATTGRALQIESDARYRFERGVDPESANWGAEMAARMILDFCGGETSNTVKAGTLPRNELNIAFDTTRVMTLGGINVSLDKQKSTLQDLGFTVSGNKIINVSPPSWRPDVHGEADLVEEITRIIGFDNIPPVSLKSEEALPQPALSGSQRKEYKVRRALAAQGLQEAITWSFMASKNADLFGGSPDKLHLVNPISSDLDVLRPSILPNLIMAAIRNTDRGLNDLGLFELGPAYTDNNREGQLSVAAGIRQGDMSTRHWSSQSRAVDTIDAKSDALAALEATGLSVKGLKIVHEAPSHYHPGRSAGLSLGKNTLAWFGDLHPAVLSKLGARGSIVGFEVFLNNVPEGKEGKSRRPSINLSPFQPVNRDFAFIVDDDIHASHVLDAVHSAVPDLITNVKLFDVYSGKGIEAGKKSLAIEVRLQSKDSTLTEEEIDQVSELIVSTVFDKTGGTLRQ
jgi:phenylalanyl-tRNA synthetase beta chain|tara:strand:- start:3349 stop:5742 length:2394 start_codon:yes stop_codon:yes gene_type:complete